MTPTPLPPAAPPAPPEFAGLGVADRRRLRRWLAGHGLVAAAVLAVAAVAPRPREGAIPAADVLMLGNSMLAFNVDGDRLDAAAAQAGVAVRRDPKPGTFALHWKNRLEETLRETVAPRLVMVLFREPELTEEALAAEARAGTGDASAGSAGASADRGPRARALEAARAVLPGLDWRNRLSERLFSALRSAPAELASAAGRPLPPYPDAVERVLPARAFDSRYARPAASADRQRRRFDFPATVAGSPLPALVELCRSAGALPAFVRMKTRREADGLGPPSPAYRADLDAWLHSRGGAVLDFSSDPALPPGAYRVSDYLHEAGVRRVTDRLSRFLSAWHSAGRPTDPAACERLFAATAE
jgi:hypothetical protein